MVRVHVNPARRPSPPAPVRGGSVVPIESDALRANPLGDPFVRDVGVYTPATDLPDGLPLILLLAGFAGEGSHLARRPPYLGESELGIFDRLVRAGRCPPAVVVAPDCLTALGGSQYVNSSSTGAYADFVLDELIPWARERYRTGAVAVVGQSSGGFGALHLSAVRPGWFTAVGVSAGDMAFDLTFPLDIPRAVRAFRRFGGPERFLERISSEPWLLRGPTDPSGSALLLLAMSACYSPRDDGTGDFDLPFDPETGERDPEVWARWLAFDPLVRAERAEAQEAWRKLRALHVTASSEDEWFLDIAARRFVARLGTRNVPATYEEFPGGHFDKRPRFESVFETVGRALTAEAGGSTTHGVPTHG